MTKLKSYQWFHTAYHTTSLLMEYIPSHDAGVKCGSCWYLGDCAIRIAEAVGRIRRKGKWESFHYVVKREPVDVTCVTTDKMQQWQGKNWKPLQIMNLLPIFLQIIFCFIGAAGFAKIMPQRHIMNVQVVHWQLGLLLQLIKKSQEGDAYMLNSQKLSIWHLVQRSPYG